MGVALKNNFLCSKCKDIAGVGFIIKGKIYCQKCGQILSKQEGKKKGKKPSVV